MVIEWSGLLKVDNTIIAEKTASGESLMVLTFKKTVLPFRAAYTKGERSSVKIDPQQCHIEFNIQKYILMHHHTIWVNSVILVKSLNFVLIWLFNCAHGREHL